MIPLRVRTGAPPRLAIPLRPTHLALTPSLPTTAYDDAPSRSVRARLLAWMWSERWLLCIFFGALAVRLHWNLEVHPLGDYVYSDMHGYVARAERLIDEFPKPHEYSAFFPFGTHWMVAAVKLLFGESADTALSVWYALIGASTVSMAYAVARRASGFAIVPPAVGLLGIFYYPHFSLGGYILSEPPYTFFLVGAVLSILRMADHGRRRDALALGAFAGVGALFRPQLLLSAALVGLFWIVRRKTLSNIRFSHLMLSAIPLAVCLLGASIHLHHNTGRYGLISENGSFNLVFGRCHNSKIESLPDGKGHGKVHFRPPPLLQVVNAQDKARRERVQPALSMNPAFGDTFSYRGYIGDNAQHHEYIRRCYEKTKLGGQLRYSWDNMSLLWFHNIPWPDSGRAAWRNVATWWTAMHREWIMVPSLLGLLWVLVPGRRGARMGLIALQPIALMMLAALFFGGIRHRAPYDLLLILLAFETYALAGVLAWRLVQRFRGGGGAGIGGGADAGPEGAATAGDVGGAGDATSSSGSPAQNSSSS